MSDLNEPTEHLVRINHSMRAIARTLLLLLTYQVVSGALAGIGLGVSLADSGADTGWFVFAGAVALVGLGHAIFAGWTEFKLSEPADGIETVLRTSKGGSGPQPGQKVVYVSSGFCGCDPVEREKAGGIGWVTKKKPVCRRCGKQVEGAVRIAKH